MKQMNQRQMKVAEEVRHIVGLALLRGDVPTTVPLSRLTVTDVWASADLRLARLYIDIPADMDMDATLQALNAQVAGPLRKVLAKQLATKYIPAVSFFATENES
ncbi:MAG: ribosome-binding factor A [Pseudomonadaceae bacterium]|nr:ribosome-binding factor A [Pseudomonadaceae bacterium]